MEDNSTKVFVGSIDFNATEKDVEDAFKPFGEIVHITLLRDKETQKSRGFGFITFKESFSVEAAIKGMHKQPILGRPIVVSYASRKSNNGGSVQNNMSSQPQMQGSVNNNANSYYQQFSAQQGYANWNPQAYGAWNSYWAQQQGYGGYGQWWNPQMQNQQSANQFYSGYQQSQGYGNSSTMPYANNSTSNTSTSNTSGSYGM